MTEHVPDPHDSELVLHPSVTPLVFISYSHDSLPHKTWVAHLASRLLDNGIDVSLDEWDVELGDDLPSYMEQSIAKADRVLVICTDEYIRKAEGGQGGVAYERMIVTAELVANVGTSKFIPVVRNVRGDQKTPKFLASRKHVDPTFRTWSLHISEFSSRACVKSRAVPA